MFSKATKTKTVTIYTLPTDINCLALKKYLKQNNIDFVEKNTALDRQALNEMISLTKQASVPVIVINGKTFIGFNKFVLAKELFG